MENEVVESVNNLEVAEQEVVVESTTDSTEQVDEHANGQVNENINGQTDESVDETNHQEEMAEESKGEQSKEERAKYASARRKAEEENNKKRLEQIRQEAYEQGLAQGKVQSYIGKQNPYTGQIINDDYDAQEYLEMFELDSKGKDPIMGHRELQKEKARKEAEEKVKADEKAKQEKWYKDDTKDFVDKYSADKLQELTKDEDFNVFAEGKIGNVPLAQIYESYQKLINKYEKKSVETAKQIVANNVTTPGAIDEGEPQVMDWNSMTKEQFEKYMKRAKDGELK